MASISGVEPASAELLACILAGDPFPDALLRRALVEDEGRSLFSVVVERLGDLFEPHLCDAYARLFTRVVELLFPDRKAVDLLNRYERVRQVKPCDARRVRKIYVLSRVTLGADVAVTSVLLDAARKRYPRAEVYFVGSKRNHDLFAARGDVRHMPFSYARSGTLPERLKDWPRFDVTDAIVIDPDSRLSQLGILPVCDEERYFFFESRSYGGNGSDPLPVLAARWAKKVFDVEPRAYIAPEPAQMQYEVAVSFGVGENQEKRIAGPFEELLLQFLLGQGFSVVVDRGAGGEEAARVDRLRAHAPGVETFDGPYAPFASMISQAMLYVGYDSAGQHVAAAAGVPLVSVFAGYPSDRMFQRWAPYGFGTREVVKVTDRNPDTVLAAATAAVLKASGRCVTNKTGGE